MAVTSKRKKLLAEIALAILPGLAKVTVEELKKETDSIDSRQPIKEQQKEQPLLRELEIYEMKNITEKIARFLEKSEFMDVLEIYANPRKRLLSNFLAGLSRGLGMTLGTVVVLAILGWLLSKFVTIPVIGEYISRIVDYVKLYQ